MSLDLKAVEARYTGAKAGGYFEAEDLVDDVPLLLAEIERLRAVVASAATYMINNGHPEPGRNYRGMVIPPDAPPMERRYVEELENELELKADEIKGLEALVDELRGERKADQEEIERIKRANAEHAASNRRAWRYAEALEVFIDSIYGAALLIGVKFEESPWRHVREARDFIQECAVRGYDD